MLNVLSSSCVCVCVRVCVCVCVRVSFDRYSHAVFYRHPVLE